MDDIVGINILQRGGGRVVVVQRRKEALKTIAACCEVPAPELAPRKSFIDLVGNPVLVNVDEVVSAVLVPVDIGPKLLADLAPVPPDFDVMESAPELLAKPAGAQPAASSLKAGDIDAVEKAQGR